MKIAEILSADNLASGMSDERRNEIGRKVCTEFKADKESRHDWEKTYEDANRLALQMVEPKNTPWQGASNVKFPALTIAATQFNARMYPFIVNDGRIVKARVIGDDPGGVKKARGERKASYLNWQLMEEDECWEEDVDRLGMVLPIVGTCFRRTFWCPDEMQIKSELVLPSQLVVNYWARKIEDTRKTVILNWTKRDIQAKTRSGQWLEFDLPSPAQIDDEIKQGEDQRAGKQSPGLDDDQETRPILQQYTFLDLDGDGYEEPYIITVDYTTQKVFRIVANFTDEGIRRTTDKEVRALGLQAQELFEREDIPDEAKLELMQEIEGRMIALREKGKIFRIEADEEFTTYQFIPNPDGSSIYGLGFGALLGPINESINTLINQLIDSGTLQNSNSGFIGRGARMTKGAMRFAPFEWKQVSVTGGKLADNIMPLPVNTPSPVLFNLLGLLIDYAERISSVKDMMVGETPGQNTPATTSMAALEQGMKVFTGIFKRIYRSLDKELKRRYKLNYVYLDKKQYVEITGTTLAVMREDFLPAKDIIPTADVTTITSAEKMIRAQFLAERAAMTGTYNMVAVEQRLLEAMQIPNSQEVFPVTQDEQGNMAPAIQPPPSAEAQEIELKAAEAESRTIERKQRGERDDMLAEMDALKTMAEIQSMSAGDAKVMNDALMDRARVLTEQFRAITEREKVKADGRKAESGDRGGSE